MGHGDVVAEAPHQLQIYSSKEIPRYLFLFVLQAAWQVVPVGKSGVRELFRPRPNLPNRLTQAWLAAKKKKQMEERVLWLWIDGFR